MSARPAPAAPLARAVVCTAACLVPRGQRAEWRAEWQAELWHVAAVASRRAHGAGSAGPLTFSLGALRDAGCLRWHHLRSRPPLPRGSAERCGLALALFAASGLLLCSCLPGAREALLPIHPGYPADLVLIASQSASGQPWPTLPVADYREWKSDTGRLFSQMAYVRPAVRDIYLPRHRPVRLSLALATQNLFAVLHLPEARSAAGARLILSDAAWRRDYRADPSIFGHTADIDGEPVVIAGVLPQRAWHLQGSPQAWLLDDQLLFEASPPQARGLVLARIRDAAFPAPRGGAWLMTETRAAVQWSYLCISMRSLGVQPTFNFLMVLLLACLALPATTALPLGDYPRHRDRLPPAVTARRWVFLAMKFLFVPAGVYFWSLALAYGPGFAGSTAILVQMAASFPLLLLAIRWILQDQRRRCPICLRRLSNPARVGQASCNFLSWSGTELFCSQGHGLLYIPELPTSWFSTQRWLCLDSSWLCLFPERQTTSPEIV